MSSATPPNLTIVRAGAGAGKTTELIRRVIDFIVNVQKTQDRDPRVSLTTFTRKATQEIRERLVAKAIEIGDDRLLRYVQQSKSLHISTIHGSLRRYLSQYGSAMGLAPDFTLMDAIEEARLIKRCLRKLLRTHPEVATAYQQLAEDWDLTSFIQAYRDDVLNRIRFPNAQPVGRAEILAGQEAKLKKIEQLARNLNEVLVGRTLTKPWLEFQGMLIATLESQNRSLLDWSDFEQTRPTLSKGKAVEDIISLKDDFLKELDALVDKDNIPEYRWSPEFAERSELMIRAFETVAQNLRALVDHEKRVRGKLSMNDLELMSLELSQKEPGTAEKFSQQWDFWLVDEYQDTSPLQVDILKRIVGKGREFVVGDPQQSIYLFRGARSEVFQDKEDLVRKSAGEIKILNKNYRSEPSLMTLLNKFLPEMSSQLQPMEIGYNKEVTWTEKSGLFWTIPYSNKNEDGTTKPREKYREAVDNGTIERLQELLNLGVSPENICVLGRRNSELEKLAVRAQAAGLPVHLNASSQFAHRREIRDAIAWLKFLVNPHDNINLVELLRSPWFPATDAFLAELGHTGKLSYWQRWNSDSKLRSQHVDILTHLQTALVECENSGVSQIWQKSLIDRGMIDWSHRVDPTGRREGNLWKLVTDLRFAERQAGFSYAQFIRDLDVPVADEEQIDAEAPAVIELKKINIMTIHASKGLQFDHVIVPDVGAKPDIKIRQKPFIASEIDGTWSLALRGPEKGSLASSAWTMEQLEMYKEREYQETDRLLYVALTRAQKSISLIWMNENRKLDAKSWAARFEHRQNEFAEMVEIRNRDSAPEKMEIAQKTKRTVRKPWAETVSSALPVMKSQDRPLDIKSLEKIQRGIDVHRMLEALKYNWDAEGSEVIEWRDRVSAEKEVNVRYLIENGHVEFAFLVKLPDGKLMNGRIDLWGFDESGNPWIIDYKTGDPKYADKAFAQMEAYAWALQALGLIPKTQSVKLLPIFFDGPMQSRVATGTWYTDVTRTVGQLITQ